MLKAKFNFMYTVLCPACGNLAEFSIFGVEVIADGVDLGVCKCGKLIQCHLTTHKPGTMKSGEKLAQYLKEIEEARKHFERSDDET